MKFVASYSGGKDSILAIDEAMREGHEPVALLTTCDEKHRRSWFHNIPYEVLEEAARSLGLPLVMVNTEGETYARDFERTLTDLKNQGVQMCVFGDIDIQEHFDWCHNRCVRVGLKSHFPLWGRKRKDLVHALIDRGFEAVIIKVNPSVMSETYLGKTLTHTLIKELEADGIDVCGENGEYHTLVTDGRIFKTKVIYGQ